VEKTRLLKDGYLIEGRQIKSRRMLDAERKERLMNYERPRKNSKSAIIDKR
jgi:hypothetical protein